VTNPVIGELRALIGGARVRKAEETGVLRAPSKPRP
jgi:hypothetical protein